MTRLGDKRNLNYIQKAIEDELNRVGLLFRVFSRAKSERSLLQKINRGEGKYSSEGKKIQDLYGFRVAVYFPDDLNISQRAIKNIFDFDEESSAVDLPENDIFSATRCNLVFRLNQDQSRQSEMLQEFDLLDATFEVQFRTVLSEGWHEVEHDLRYKCKGDWNEHNDLSRALNGIYASLETSDWSMLKLFESICHRHYKNREWQAMVRNKFRLRAGNLLSPAILEIFDSHNEQAKEFFKLSRSAYLNWVLDSGLDLPINLDNSIYAANYKFVKSPEILDKTPDNLKLKLDELAR